ncbi:DUF2970 domain-containing protein [Neptuniibacter caesariensis]|nr:DUF2970 domain-containing protein [Neptuniibacter caesariensis]
MKAPKENRESPGLWSMLLSVLAAFFGVQTQRNYQRDFASGRFWPYAVLGIVMALSFVGLVYLLVALVLAQ